MKKIAFLMVVASFLAMTGRGQTVYYDSVQTVGPMSTTGRLCANIVPITLGYYDTTVQLTRLSVVISGFPNAVATGAWYLDYQIGSIWHSIAEGNFSVPIDQTLPLINAQVGLFEYLQATISYNGIRIGVVFQ